MKQLSELLLEAKEDGPPARFDIEDVVVAGRRLRRRRATGWAALVAAVAVAAVIGVPQIVAHPEGSRPLLPAAPTPSSPPIDVHPGNLPFRGYAVDGYRVEDPTGASPTWGSSDVIATRTGKTAAWFLFYTPDADVKATYGSGTWTEIEPINGRPAFDLDFEEAISVIWEYADGAYAMVEPAENVRVSRADLRRIAEGFKPGPGEVIRTMVRVGYVPPGYRVDGIGSHGAGFRTGNVMEISADEMPAGMINILVSEPLGPFPRATGPTCDRGRGCRKPVGEKYELSVRGQGLTDDELRKVFESVTLADRDDPSTWLVARESIPPHTLVQLR